MVPLRPLAVVALLAPHALLAAAAPLNVLFIAIDDLRHSGAAFGDAEVLMPNLDRLAADSTIFTEAYVQAATCGVSRASLLTSRRPDTTHVLSNGACPFTTRESHAAWRSLPQYFREVILGLSSLRRDAELSDAKRREEKRIEDQRRDAIRGSLSNSAPASRHRRGARADDALGTNDAPPSLHHRAGGRVPHAWRG